MANSPGRLLTFIRHGESETNVAERWQGQGDSVLSRRGKEQASQLAERLSAFDFDLVVASDLSRASQTARAISRKVDLDPGWREIDLGRWEGLTRDEVFARYPKEVHAVRAGEPIKIGGGEAWAEVQARGIEALDRTLDRVPRNGHALVVAHGGILISLVRHLVGLSGDVYRALGRLDNTSLTTIRFDGVKERARASIEAFNDVAHLGFSTKFAEQAYKSGERLVTLIGPDAKRDLPRRLHAQREFDASAELTGHALESTVRRFSNECPDAAVVVSPAAAEDFLATALGATTSLGAPGRALTSQLVVGEHITVADFNVGHL